MKRISSVKDSQKQKRQRLTTSSEFRKAITSLRQPELEKCWETDKSFTIILLDTSSLKRHKETIASCIAKQPYPGSVYLLRMHGGLLSNPFWTKIEQQVSEEDKVEAVNKFFVDGLKDGSPLWMTIHWVDAALRRNQAMKDATKIIVMTNSTDNPYPETMLRTKHGTQLSYNIRTDSGYFRTTDLRNGLRTFLNLKWVFVIPDYRVYESFRKLKRKKAFFFTLLHNSCSDVLSFRLSKMFDVVQAFQPRLKEGQIITLDRRDNEMKRFKHMWTPFNEAETRQFLKRNNEATMIKERCFVTIDVDNEHGKYHRLVRGCIFETRAEGHVVRYTLYNYATLGLKDRVVTLKRNTKTDYLGRSCNTMYRVIEENCVNEMVLVQDFDENRDNKFLVPRSKVVLEDKCLLI